MSQESLVFLTGLCVFVTPLLGIPHTWKTWIVVSLGVILLILGYRLRRAAYLRSLQTETGERQGDAFVESNGIVRRQGDLSVEVMERRV